MGEHTTTQLIGIAIPTLRELRTTTLACLSSDAAGDSNAVDALREAGFAGGQAVYEAFEQWLAESGVEPSRSATELPLTEFGDRTAEYFRAAGWGTVEFDGGEGDGVATVDIGDCWESDELGQATTPSCHVTTGMLAAFFGQLAGYPVAVMEAECRTAGADRCRFLLGNSDVMASRWEALR